MAGVALVGYTNAGKSTLLNALADADLYAADMLFATLDPTSRQVPLPTGQHVVVTDTVGFINKLPHDLVDAFRATLEEVMRADLLLEVVDAADPDFIGQQAAVQSVLDELGAGAKPRITVYNKVDLLPGRRDAAAERADRVRERRHRRRARRPARQDRRSPARGHGPGRRRRAVRARRAGRARAKLRRRPRALRGAGRAGARSPSAGHRLRARRRRSPRSSFRDLPLTASVPLRPDLRDELVGMAERELAAAEAFFADVAAERRLERELDDRLAGPATPLIAVLEGWEEAPPSAAPCLPSTPSTSMPWTASSATMGGPGCARVGVDGADAAWLLARHADRDNERRRAWLTPLADAVASGDADPRHLATLADRTAVVGGDPQPYGTIVLLAPDGELEYPVPVLDHAKLDERRDALGLPPAVSEAPYLGDGDLEPYGPDRGSNPVNQWPITLEGHVSVEAALAGGSRRVHRIWATRPGDRRLGRLRALARERGVLIDAVDAATIDEVATGRTPWRRRRARRASAAARTSPTSPARWGRGRCSSCSTASRTPSTTARRSARSTRRAWTGSSPVGAGRRPRRRSRAPRQAPVSCCRSRSPTAPQRAATICRRRGLKVAAAVADADAVPMAEADLSGGWFILIGGERRGVTRSFVDEADLVFRIDYGRPDAPALGAAVSAALIGFEVLAPAARPRVLEDAAAGKPVAGRELAADVLEATPHTLTDREAGDEVQGRQRDEKPVADRQGPEVAADGGAAEHAQAAERKPDDRHRPHRVSHAASVGSARALAIRGRSGHRTGTFAAVTTQ